MNKLTALILLGTVSTAMADSHLTKEVTFSDNLGASFTLNEDETEVTVQLTLTGVTAARSGQGYWFGIGWGASGADMHEVDFNTCKIIWNNKATDGCECFDWSYPEGAQDDVYDWAE